MNEQKYKKAFIESFNLPDTTEFEKLEYNTFEEWDSIGHMQLVAALETEFDIMMDMDDIIDFSTYEKGKEILKKYEVAF
ncbi:phosphopantetheine-binding protein [Saccharibacillus deserti]|uniref:phosphopantetheine-binding protein n=1 Tax=Saccharibacillus deserti TaxID=1634444 RepID=UPI0015539005|nr:phosphopantetheine-binding protein [Saccharibacillus deserti]